MELDYRPAPPTVPRESAAYRLLLKSLTMYFLISAMTLPFLNVWWWGEVPVLALIQLPKVQLAQWIRIELVMPAIRQLGLSYGSFSPDYSLVRPYALAIAYVVPLGLVLGWIRARAGRPQWRWMLIVLAAATIDFCFTLHFANGRALTIY